MMLLIDAGNTRIKWALVRADADVEMAGEPARIAASWVHSGSVARADWMQLGDIWRSAGKVAGAGVRRVLVSNVAGVALREQLQSALQGFPSIEWLVSQAELGGVRNAYRQPEKLGCDRFASAIAAHALFPGRALVVATCGTATTIDAMTPDGGFIGGMILPGLGLMAASLALNTAQLPQVSEISAVTSWFADATEPAIVAGCIAAQTGAIKRALHEHRQHYPEAVCLLAGGAGPYLSAHLAEPHQSLDNLVLIGLHILANKYPRLC